jgi:hypothetical protein
MEARSVSVVSFGVNAAQATPRSRRDEIHVSFVGNRTALKIEWGELTLVDGQNGICKQAAAYGAAPDRTEPNDLSFFIHQTSIGTIVPFGSNPREIA